MPNTSAMQRKQHITNTRDLEISNTRPNGGRKKKKREAVKEEGKN